MPLAVGIIFSFITTVIVYMVTSGVSTISDRTFQDAADKRALSTYHETGSFPSSVTVFSRNIATPANRIDTSYISENNYNNIRHYTASAEQAIVNACVTIYQTCGRDSRMQPVVNALRSTNLASSSSVTVSPDKNGYLSFNSTITGGGNAWVYYRIYNLSYTIQTGDRFVYDVYIPSGLPQYLVGEMELGFTDSTYGSAYSLYDQNNLKSDTGNLAAYAGKWYHRDFSLNNVAGKTTNSIEISNESDTAGSYNGILYKNMVIADSSSSIKLRIWDPSYLFAFLNPLGGKVSDLLTTGTTASTVNCLTAAETEFEQYGRYLIRNALGTSALQSVTLNSVVKEIYYTKPAGGAACGYTDITELR